MTDDHSLLEVALASAKRGSGSCQPWHRGPWGAARRRPGRHAEQASLAAVMPNRHNAPKKPERLEDR